jgi:Cu(I)/Ag(I) efflux system protein CusF
MKKAATLLFALTLCGVAQTAIAQSAAIDGQVTKVDQSAKKITIKHGPIRKLDMDEGMTMVFVAPDPNMLKAVKAGDKVKFDAERVNGQLTLKTIEKAK